MVLLCIYCSQIDTVKPLKSDFLSSFPTFGKNQVSDINSDNCCCLITAIRLACFIQWEFMENNRWFIVQHGIHLDLGLFIRAIFVYFFVVTSLDCVRKLVAISA